MQSWWQWSAEMDHLSIEEMWRKALKKCERDLSNYPKDDEKQNIPYVKKPAARNPSSNPVLHTDPNQEAFRQQYLNGYNFSKMYLENLDAYSPPAQKKLHDIIGHDFITCDPVTMPWYDFMRVRLFPSPLWEPWRRWSKV